jgi:hypothetical protein
MSKRGIVMTPAEMNSYAREFWEREQPLFERRMADRTIREIAFAHLTAERTKGLPIRFQTSIYEALATAEGNQQRSLREQSQKGGKAKKSDALQQFIEERVQANPSLTAQQHNGLVNGYLFNRTERKESRPNFSRAAAKRSRNEAGCPAFAPRRTTKQTRF